MLIAQILQGGRVAASGGHMRVFITGGLTGMGLEVSKRFLKDGHTVGICSFQSPDEIQSELLDGVEYYQSDVRDHVKMREVINEFHQKHGSLDVVIANAGINHKKASIPDWDRGRMVIETNLIGTLNTFAPSIDIMKEQGSGQLVSLASVSAFAGLPGMSCYGASKAAVLSMCESLEIDLAEYGITVTTLAPGFVSTPLTEDNGHKMPFLIDQDTAANNIMDAIYGKKGLTVFPLPMSFVSKVLKHMPRSLYKKVMKSDLLGMRQG
jgi:NAD(P)-dependent dehydrogenase (short-subunit alcohol dehydrogenase family)